MTVKILIIGGGQLARMMAQEARRTNLPVSITVLDPTSDCPAAEFVDRAVVGAYDDAIKIRELAEQADVITYEIELAGHDVLAALAESGKPVHPSPNTLGIIRNKLRQKQFLAEAGLPIPAVYEVNSVDDVRRLLEQTDRIMLKAKHGAYDGRGNALVQSPDGVEAAFEKLRGKEIFAERCVDFSAEISVIAVRDVNGVTFTYPVCENIHANNILHTTIAPARIDPKIAQEAQTLAAQALEALDGAGVFGVEMFVEDGHVLINEIAPRVHNSGHYTIEACVTSQFHNHLRAVCGMPLGDTGFRPGVSAAVMHNLLGPAGLTGAYVLEGAQRAESLGASIHDYGKRESRPERKIGHFTLVGADVTATLAAANGAFEAIQVRR